MLSLIINDQCLKFLSKVKTTLFKMCETIIKPSRAYHLEIDGQIDWTFEDMLQMYVRKRQ